MSLFNKVGDGLAKRGGLGSLTDAIGGRIAKGGAALTKALGGGPLAQATVGIGEVMVGNAVQGAINSAMPPVVRNGLNVAGGMVGDIMSGDWQSAGLRALDSGLIDGLFGGGSARSQSRYWSGRTPLFGGISPREAKAIYDTARAETLAKKNLWLLEVTNAAGVEEGKFNLFATEVEYAPFTITGEKRRVGAASIDGVVGGEPTELRIVTMDDAEGTIKKWFALQSALVEHRDGTVGLPDQYKVGIRILHGVITRTQRVAYEDKGLFRPASIDISLSRREDGMQELQMAFTQLDTFMR